MQDHSDPQSRDWPTIRDAYEHGGETIAAICRRFGVTRGALEYRQRKDRWTPRSAPESGSRSILLGRMFKVLDKQVQRLERKDVTEQTDKDVSLLNDMARALEKLNDIEKADRGKTTPQKKDMRDLRDKLARRLDQFKQR